MKVQAAKPEDMDELKRLDSVCFPNCGDEFTPNRKWWIVRNGKKIVAYAGAAYADGVCIFVRAWVGARYRKQGIHHKLIAARMRHAKRLECYRAVTYTVKDNTQSANNLVRRGFLLYTPSYVWAGREQLYFFKDI